MRYFLTLALCVALTGCATSDLGQKAGQGNVDQRHMRGGFFSSYTGKTAGQPGKTKIKGTTPDGEVDLLIESASPFVINFGEIEANTEASTAGQSADSQAGTQTPTTDVRPQTDANLTK